MSFIKQHEYASIDRDEIQRAAGALEIASMGEADETARAMLTGASALLRIIEGCDVEDAAHLVRIYRTYVFGEVAEERSADYAQV